MLIRSVGPVEPIPFQSVLDEMPLDRIRRYFRFLCGPRVPITSAIDANPYDVNTQADADYLVGKRVNGWIRINGAGLYMRDTACRGVAIDPALYTYAIDASGYPSGQTAIDTKAALAAAARQLMTFMATAAGTTVEFCEIDGINERAYAGFGGQSYTDDITMRFNRIRRIGDDGGKMTRGMLFEYNCVDEFRPWVEAVDGTYYGAPNDNRNPHQDPLQIIRGNATIRRNLLLGTTTATSTSGMLLAKPDTGEGSTSLIFEENIGGGGNNYPIQLVTQTGVLGGTATLDGVIVRRNLVSRDFAGNGAHPDLPYAIGSLYVDQVEFDGNRWLEDRSAIAVPTMATRP